MMGFASQSEFEKELSDLGIKSPIPARPIPDNNETKVIQIEHGRGHKSETPQVIREFIAEESICGANAKQLQSEFHISQSSISAYKQGATSTATIDRPQPELKKHVDLTKLKIRNGARAKLEMALESLTKEKIENSNAVGISAVAKNLSSIMHEHEESSDSHDRVQVVIFQPRMKEEDEFEAVTVHE